MITPAHYVDQDVVIIFNFVLSKNQTLQQTIVE